MFFNDPSSQEEEEDNDDFEMAIDVTIHEGTRQARLGSQFGRLYINRDRAEDHTNIMKDYFAPNAAYP